MSIGKVSKPMYSVQDSMRKLDESDLYKLAPEEYRNGFRRDYARLLHSASFRRLSGKTQLFPGTESDFFRNRLSHSLEVAQVAKSIAIKLNSQLAEHLKIDTDLVEFAALAHDIGHPPFGHQGEKALDQCMIDCGGFEGNAQTLRIIARLEKKFLTEAVAAPLGILEGADIRCGLNLTWRSLASVLKYDKAIPISKEDRLQVASLSEHEIEKIEPVKGYYSSDAELVDLIKVNVLNGQGKSVRFKTVECSIMDIADDIAYSTYDLEDGLKAGFYHPLDIIYSKNELLRRVAEKVNRKLETEFNDSDIQELLMSIFNPFLLSENDSIETGTPDDTDSEFHRRYRTSKMISENGYSRTALTSFLVGKFIRGVEIQQNEEFPELSIVKLNDEVARMVEVLKHYNYESMIISPRLRVAEYRGQEIVKKIFESLSDESNKGYQLMPRDFQEIYLEINSSEKKRVVCDFIAGMTDRYCIEFYGRLTSENPETIFKPM